MKLFAVVAAFAAFSLQAQTDRLSPALEGLYETTFKCASSCSGVKNLDQMTFVDAGRGGIQIVFHNTKVGVASYRLLATRVDREGEHLEADAFTSMGRAIEWVGDIDKVTGKLTGRLRLSAFDDEIEVEGKRLFSTASFYQTQPVSDRLGLLDIQGNYLVLGDRDSKLAIRASLSGSPAVVASWDMGHGARTDFTDSEFLPEQGVLLLYSHWSGGATKWTVAFRRNSSGAVEGKLRGIANGSSGFGYDLTLKRPSQRGSR